MTGSALTEAGPKKSKLVTAGLVLMALGLVAGMPLTKLQGWLQSEGLEGLVLVAAVAGDLLRIGVLVGIGLLLVGLPRNRKWAKSRM